MKQNPYLILNFDQVFVAVTFYFSWDNKQTAAKAMPELSKSVRQCNDKKGQLKYIYILVNSPKNCNQRRKTSRTGPDPSE